MSESSLPAKENEQYLHEHLTEDSIRHVALRFLKTYYKYRPRAGETTVGKNMTTASGIIVDGYLSFTRPDEKPFLATLEATSYAKRGEVKYTLQKRIMFWDAMAVGSLAGLLLFSYGYAYQHFTVNQVGLLGSLAILVGTIALVFLLFRLFSKNFSRYRYIYAVEQFKRYAANEQWIAFGEDVFSSPNSKRLAELKKQCVYNGFGLVMADKEFEPHLLITPARTAVVTGRKQIFKVLSDNRLREIIRKSPLEKGVTKLKSLFGKVREKSPVRSQDLLRYQQKFWRQAATVAVCFGLLSFILYRELEEADIIHVDNKVYLDEMSQLAGNSRPETEEYLIDTAAMVAPFDPDENVYDQDYADIQDDLQYRDGDGNTQGGTVDYQTDRLPNDEIIKTEEVAVYHNGNYIYYDCTRFFGFKGKKYVVTDGLFGTLSAAQRRIRQLDKNKIPAHAFWVGCFDKTRGYVVYYDQIYNERNTAQRAAEAFGEQFGQVKVPRGELGIMVLER